MENYISPRASLGEGVYLGQDVRIFGSACIGGGTFIDDNVVIGYPYSGEIRQFMQRNWQNRDLSGLDETVVKKTIIGEKSVIGRGTIISAGSSLGSGADCEFEIFIGTDTVVGNRTRFVYRAQVYDGVKIGDDCVIGGFVGDRSTLGNRVRMLGHLIHSHKVPVLNRPGWDELKEEGPIIEDDAIIGYGAIVVGERNIGRGAYVLAGAIVTKDVSAEDLVGGVPAVSIKDKIQLPN